MSSDSRTNHNGALAFFATIQGFQMKSEAFHYDLGGFEMGGSAPLDHDVVLTLKNFELSTTVGIESTSNPVKKYRLVLENLMVKGHLTDQDPFAEPPIDAEKSVLTELMSDGLLDTPKLLLKGHISLSNASKSNQMMVLSPYLDENHVFKISKNNLKLFDEIQFSGEVQFKSPQKMLKGSFVVALDPNQTFYVGSDTFGGYDGSYRVDCDGKRVDLSFRNPTVRCFNDRASFDLVVGEFDKLGIVFHVDETQNKGKGTIRFAGSASGFLPKIELDYGFNVAVSRHVDDRVQLTMDFVVATGVDFKIESEILMDQEDRQTFAENTKIKGANGITFNINRIDLNKEFKKTQEVGTVTNQFGTRIAVIEYNKDLNYRIKYMYGDFESMF